MNDQRIYVFNQYYIDLLKKLKNYAKDLKDNSKTARDILRAIKKNYASMDKLNDSYIKILTFTEFWDAYELLEDPIKSSDVLEIEIYSGISFGSIVEIFMDKHTLHHYLMIFNIFRDTELQIDQVIDVLKHILDKSFEEKLQLVESPKTKELLTKLKKLHSTRTSNVLENELKELENSSLGKLAKEIMNDIDINEIQNTLQTGNLDILGSLQNPDSGFGKLVSSVSTKMLSKLASGELQQEKLLEDALGLASKLPSMMPGMGDIGKNMSGLNSMLQQLQKMGMNPADMMKGMSGAQRNAASSRMHSASRKNKMSERLKKKIREKNSKENNNQSEVVEDV